jgi:hypothetical protein
MAPDDVVFEAGCGNHAWSETFEACSKIVLLDTDTASENHSRTVPHLSLVSRRVTVLERFLFWGFLSPDTNSSHIYHPYVQFNIQKRLNFNRVGVVKPHSEAFSCET